MTRLPTWWPKRVPDTPAVNGGIWESLKARLDVTQYTAVQAPGVIFKELVDASGRHFMLKNTRTHTYVRLTPEEFWVWQRLDGEHTVQQLVVDYFREFSAFAFAAITGMLEQLRDSSMLSEAPKHLYAEVSEEIHKQGFLQQLSRLGRAALSSEYVIPRLDERLDRIYRQGGWLLYTRPAQAIFLAVSVIGLYLFVRLAADPERQILRLGSAVQFGLTAYIPIVIHEFGHALTAKHVGCEVHRGGLMLFYGLPAAFVETTDLWMFGKRERLMVTWAGSYTGYIIGGACSLAVYFLPGIPTGVATVLLQIALLGILTTTVNLLPGLKLDGYYLLSDVLEIPRLRERSLEFITRRLPGRLLAPGRWSSEEAIFLIFGLVVILSIVFFTYASIAFWDQQTSTSVAELLDLEAGLWARIRNLLMALLGASILVYSLAVLIRAAGRAIGWARRNGLVATRGRAASLLVVAALALTFLPAVALPILSKWLIVLAGLGAFGTAEWLAINTLGEMRGSVHSGMWLVAAAGFALGALEFASKMVLRRMDAGVTLGAAGVVLSATALLAAGRLRRGLRGSWRFGSLILILCGTAVWLTGLATRPFIQTLGALLILGGMIHWHMRPSSPMFMHTPQQKASTRARMWEAVRAIRATVLTELELDFGRQTRVWVENRDYSTTKKDVGEAEFPHTVPGMTAAEYGESMALSLDALLRSVRRAAGQRFTHRALALGFDGLDWKFQEIAEDYVLQYVEEAQGLSAMLAETRADLEPLIRSVPLFMGMGETELRGLRGAFKAQLFRRGESIVVAGDRGDSFYLIRAGYVEVLSGTGEHLNILGRGDYFGERALLTGERRNATIRTQSSVEVLRLERHSFDRLIRNRAHFDSATRDEIDRLRVLRSIPLFAQFDGRDLLRVAARLEEVEVAAGELVFNQGDRGDSFYVVKTGKVSVQIDGVEHATLGPGEYFGEIALVMDMPRTATIRAVGSGVLLRMTAEDFQGMLADSNSVQSAVKRASSRRLLSDERWVRPIRISALRA